MAAGCRFYWGLSLASLILYFVTSSDSGSLVIDCLTANGNPHPPILQRIFWSFTEGAVAMALLKAGGTDGLQALQVGPSPSILLCVGHVSHASSNHVSSSLSAPCVRPASDRAWPWGVQAFELCPMPPVRLFQWRVLVAVSFALRYV